MSSNFVPTLPMSVSDSSLDPIKQREREFKSVTEGALRIESCAQSIAPFKANGTMRGHKVLDDSAALHALIEAAPDHYQRILKASTISDFRKIQLMNGVLAKYWEMDRKTGKLTGNPSQSLLKRLAKNEQQATASAEA